MNIVELNSNMVLGLSELPIPIPYPCTPGQLGSQRLRHWNLIPLIASMRCGG